MMLGSQCVALLCFETLKLMTVLCLQSIFDERSDLIDRLGDRASMSAGGILECLSAVWPSGCLFVFFFVVVPFAKDDSKSFWSVAFSQHFRNLHFIHFI